MSTNMPNVKQIGGDHCKTLVDLTWNHSIENSERSEVTFLEASRFTIENGECSYSKGPRILFL